MPVMILQQGYGFTLNIGAKLISLLNGAFLQHATLQCRIVEKPV